VESVGLMIFGVAQLMHKEEQRDVAWTTSFMHIQQPKTQVTEFVQHRGRAVDTAGLTVDETLKCGVPRKCQTCACCVKGWMESLNKEIRIHILS